MFFIPPSLISVMAPDHSASYSLRDRRGAFAWASREKNAQFKTSREPAAGRHHVKPQLCADYVRNNAGATLPRVRTDVESFVFVSGLTAKCFANFRKGSARHHRRGYSTQAVDCPLRKKIVAASFLIRSSIPPRIISRTPCKAPRETRP